MLSSLSLTSAELASREILNRLPFASSNGGDAIRRSDCDCCGGVESAALISISSWSIHYYFPVVLIHPIKCGGHMMIEDELIVQINSFILFYFILFYFILFYLFIIPFFFPFFSLLYHNLFY